MLFQSIAVSIYQILRDYLISSNLNTNKLQHCSTFQSFASILGVTELVLTVQTIHCKMPKARVGQQIKEALHGKKAASSKSADIDFLTERFKQLKVKIRHLIEALRAQHLSLLRMNESRLLVSDIVSAEVFMAKSFNVLVSICITF